MNGYYWKLRVGRKYDPSQPRVPAGNPDGGQWTSFDSGNYVTESYFVDGRGKDLIDDSVRSWLKKQIIEALSRGTIKEEQISGLKRITTEPCPEIGTWEESEESGAYDPKTKTIHLRPNYFAGYKQTVIHELGHHVTIDSDWLNRHEGRGFGPVDLSFLRMRKSITERTISNDDFKGQMISMGLRPYSLTNVWEWRADSWTVYQYGSKSQQARLAEYFGVGSLDELFGR